MHWEFAGQLEQYAEVVPALAHCFPAPQSESLEQDTVEHPPDPFAFWPEGQLQDSLAEQFTQEEPEHFLPAPQDVEVQEQE